MAIKVFFFKKRKYNRSYKESAVNSLSEAWECLDAARRLLNKIGDGKSVDAIELYQNRIKTLQDLVELRNVGY